MPALPPEPATPRAQDLFDDARALYARARLALVRGALRVAPTQRQRLLALTLVIGVACGFAAVAFHLAIGLVARLAIDRALAAPGRAWIPWTLAVPTVGGLLSGALLQYVVPQARGSGVPQVKVAYARAGGPPRLRDALGKFVVSALQIGSGASLGREGPTVQICAGVASAIGRAARLSPRNLRRLIPVGAAAGIAAAFNAPIAAVTFTIEEIVGSLDGTVLSGVIVAAAVAAVVERSVLGVEPVFHAAAASPGLDSASSLALYAGLGVAAAGASLAFTEGLLRLRAWFRGLARVPRWAHPALGGAVTGGLAVVALGALHAGGVTGGGYATLGAALTGALAARVMLALCAMKLVATVCSYSSGGAGGIFAPALFIGGMLGGAVGALDVALLHHPPSTVGAFALVGMGAVFAGTIRAPMTSVLIIIEMTGGYSLILPLMIANMSAYAIARAVRPRSIYEALLAQDGVDLHPPRRVRDALDRTSLATVAVEARPFASFAPDAGTAVLLAATDPRAARQEVFPIVADGRLVGIVTCEDLALLAAEPALGGLVNAADLMRAPVALHHDDDLVSALETMLAHDVRELPLIDAQSRVIGLVDVGQLAREIQRERRSAPE